MSLQQQIAFNNACNDMFKREREKYLSVSLIGLE